MTLHHFLAGCLGSLVITGLFWPLLDFFHKREIKRFAAEIIHQTSDMIDFICAKHEIPEWQMRQTLREFNSKKDAENPNG